MRQSQVAVFGFVLFRTLLLCTVCNGQVSTPSGECYRDTDCQFFQKDSQGLVTGEVAGVCEVRSESLSICKCIDSYTGKNCEYKKCPESLVTGFMCNGNQGQGDDYYAPNGLTTAYSTSEWEKYDQVPAVEFFPTHEAMAVGGMCDFTTGRCQCHPGYLGPACDIRECPSGQGHNQLFTTKCSSQGRCVTERDGQNTVCECFENFHGNDCSKRNCPNSTRGYMCDNRGTCNSVTGFCVCDTDYYGPDCTMKKCPLVQGRVCNGQGVCFASTFDGVMGTKSQGNFTDYEGKKHNAAPISCDEMEGGGAAISMPDGSDSWTCRPFTGQKQGVCACRWPYYGDDCSLKMCPNSTAGTYSLRGTKGTSIGGSGLQCDGHGSCDSSSGACSCDAGYFGPDCAKRVCPHSTNNQWGLSVECNGEGTCNRNWGTCECENRRFWGVACEKLHCPSFPSDLSNGQRAKHTETSHDTDGYRAWTDECSGPTQGDCDVYTGKCLCKPGFYGIDCAQRGIGDGTVNRRLNVNFNEARLPQGLFDFEDDVWYGQRTQNGPS